MNIDTAFGNPVPDLLPYDLRTAQGDQQLRLVLVQDSVELRAVNPRHPPKRDTELPCDVSNRTETPFSWYLFRPKRSGFKNTERQNSRPRDPEQSYMLHQASEPFAVRAQCRRRYNAHDIRAKLLADRGAGCGQEDTIVLGQDYDSHFPRPNRHFSRPVHFRMTCRRMIIVKSDSFLAFRMKTRLPPVHIL